MDSSNGLLYLSGHLLAFTCIIKDFPFVMEQLTLNNEDKEQITVYVLGVRGHS